LELFLGERQPVGPDAVFGYHPADGVSGGDVVSQQRHVAGKLPANLPGACRTDLDEVGQGRLEPSKLLELLPVGLLGLGVGGLGGFAFLSLGAAHFFRQRRQLPLEAANLLEHLLVTGAADFHPAVGQQVQKAPGAGAFGILQGQFVLAGIQQQVNHVLVEIELVVQKAGAEFLGLQAGAHALHQLDGLPVIALGLGELSLPAGDLPQGPQGTPDHLAQSQLHRNVVGTLGITQRRLQIALGQSQPR
jgi:hypothetical protein